MSDTGISLCLKLEWGSNLSLVDHGVPQCWIWELLCYTGQRWEIVPKQAYIILQETLGGTVWQFPILF